jgi:hypothetical protein
MRNIGLSVISMWFAGCSYFLAHQVNRALPPADPSAARAEAINQAVTGLQSISSPDLYLGLSPDHLNTTLAPFLKQQVQGLEELTFEVREQELRAFIKFQDDFELAGRPGSYVASGTIYTYPRIVDRNLIFRPFADADLRVRSIKFAGQKPPNWVLTFINDVLKQYINNLNGLIAQQTVPLNFQFVTTLNSSDIFASMGPISVDPRSVRFDTGLGSSAIFLDRQALHAIADVDFSAQQQVMMSGATYEQLRDAFIAAAQQIDPALKPSEPIWSGTNVVVAKPFVASTVNQAFSAALPLCARLALPVPVSHGFNDVLRLEPAPDLNCGRLRDRSCAQTRSCDQNRDCNPNWGCDNPFTKIGCELDKQRYRTQCEIEKSAARGGCEAEKEAARIRCEIEKAAQITGCEINQVWLDEWGEMEVARVEGTGTISNGVGNICLVNGIVSSSLTNLDVNATLNARADLAANFDFTPLNAGHIACFAPFSGVLRGFVFAPDQAIGLNGVLTQDSTGGATTLNFAASFADELNLHIVPPPLLALPLQNPQVLYYCPIGVLGGAAAAGLSARARQDLINTAYPQKLPGFRTSLTLPPQEIQIGAQTIRFFSEFGQHSIVWHAQN